VRCLKVLSFAPTHYLTLAVFVVWALCSRRLLVVLMQVVRWIVCCL